MNNYQKCIVIVLFSHFRYRNDQKTFIIKENPPENAKKGIIMGARKNPESFKTLNTKQWEDWHRTIFTLFWKLWGIILFVQLLLFCFYEPTARYSRFAYFCHYILLPSGVEFLALILVWLLFTKLFPTSKRRIVSLYTIALITVFAGMTVCVHTSVKMLQALLLLPMMLTPLYKDRLMTFLQASLVIFLYMISYFYFTPRSYILPDNAFSPFVELCVFIGATVSTYIILQRVNATIVLNEDRSKHDSLTHLYNHENFYVELDYHRNLYEKNGEYFSILIADIDNFKQVNDTYGHAFGDEVIRTVGELFLQYAPTGAFCARYGGEEFAMILPGALPIPTAETIRETFAAYPFKTSEGISHFTVSIGAAIYDTPYPNSSAFFEKADNALYFAKKNGKNKVVLSGCND